MEICLTVDSVLLRCSEGKTKSNDKGLVCYFSIKVYRCFFGFGAPALIDLSVGLNIKYWSSPDPNSMRLLGLFTNKTFKKKLELIFPHRDFIICIVSLAIFHLHFVIRILSSAFFHPHFIIRIFLSASAIRRHPVRILLRPFYKRSNHELPVFSSTWAKYSFTPIPVITFSRNQF